MRTSLWLPGPLSLSAVFLRANLNLWPVRVLETIDTLSTARIRCDLGLNSQLKPCMVLMEVSSERVGSDERA